MFGTDYLWLGEWQLLQPPMFPLRLVLLGDLKEDMEGGASVIGRLSLAPGLTRVIEDFQQRFLLFVIVGNHRLGIGNEYDVSLCGKPLQIGQAFLQRVPVVSKIVWKLEGSCELIEDARRGFAFSSFNDAECKSCGRFDQGRGGRPWMCDKKG